MPRKVTPKPYEDYSEKVRRLQEVTSSGPSVVTPTMIKTDIMDPKLAEIGWRRFKFPWYTVYSPSRYRKVLDLLIHKDPNDFRPQRLRPILLFGIEANLHNKHLIQKIHAARVINRHTRTQKLW